MINPPLSTPLDKLNSNTPKPTGNEKSILELTDLIEVVTVAPTNYPKKFWDSIKIQNDSGTYYLFIYIQTIGWKKTTLS